MILFTIVASYLMCVMKLTNFMILSSLVIITSGCANKELKADEPVDYKDEVRYGFGSLIKDKDSVLTKYFGKDNSSENKLCVENVSPNSASDKLWNSITKTLEDFPIDFMDKKSGRIETGNVKVKLFDNTGTCSYKILVTMHGPNDVNVIVKSSEDSTTRLQKHSETIRTKILENLRK